jgi:hypothetical protein
MEETVAEVASSLWYQIIVTDPQGLSGSSVASFVEPIIRRLGVTVVVALDLIGACPGLMRHEKQALGRDEFLRKVADAIQYDWAFFLLYLKTPRPEELAAEDDKAAMLSADATIRLADDHYFYIYTRDEGLMSELRRKYPAAEYKTSTFGELDIPY